jgi:hypothetical protein
MRRRLAPLLGLSVALATILTALPAAAWFPPEPVGCTPGYWKQEQHFGSWQAPYEQDDLFDAYFEDAFPGLTLLQVLEGGGGGLDALGRHTVAALLNAAIFNGANDPGNYKYAVGNESITFPDEVITFFNNVYPGTKAQYNRLKDRFEAANEMGCPLGRADDQEVPPSS